MFKIVHHWRSLLEVCFLVIPALLGLLYSCFILSEPYLARLIPFVLMGFFSSGHSYLVWIYLFSGKSGKQREIPLVSIVLIGKSLGILLLFFILLLLANDDIPWGVGFYFLSAHVIWQFYKIGHLLQATSLLNGVFTFLITMCFIAYHCMPFNELTSEGALSFNFFFPYSSIISQVSIFLICLFLLFLFLILGRIVKWRGPPFSMRVFFYYVSTLIATGFTIFSPSPWALPFFAIIFAHTTSYLYLQFFTLKQHLVFLQNSPWRTGIFLFFFCGILGGFDYWLSEINLDMAMESEDLISASWEILVKSLYLTVFSMHFFLDYLLWRTGIFFPVVHRHDSCKR